MPVEGLSSDRMGVALTRIGGRIVPAILRQFLLGELFQLPWV